MILENEDEEKESTTRNIPEEEQLENFNQLASNVIKSNGNFSQAQSNSHSGMSESYGKSEYSLVESGFIDDKDFAVGST